MKRAAASSILWVPVLVAILGLAPATLLAQAETPEAAVTYTELTDEGPYPEDEGRALGNGRLRVAVDINSRLQVAIDNDKLQQALAIHRPEAQEDPHTVRKFNQKMII